MEPKNKEQQKLARNQYHQRIWSYVGLRMRLSFRPAIPQKLWKRVLTWVGILIVYSLFLFIAYRFIRSLANQTTLLPPQSLSILFYTIAQIIILIFSITNQTLRLHRPNDLSIIKSFPLSPFQRYLGEIVSIYFKISIYTFFIYWPIMIVYGCAGHMFTPAFAFSSLFASILLPLLPFGVAMILSVPFMFLSSWLSDKNIVKLVLFIIFFAAIIIVYGFLLHLMSEWYITAQTTVDVIKGLKMFVDSLNRPYNPCFFISEISLANSFGINFGIYLAFSVLTIGIGLAITIPLYKKFTSSTKNLELAARIKATKITNYTSTKAIFVKEFKQIIRNPSYAYFYIGVTISMPILTFFTIDIVTKMGESSVGVGAFFGFALLTICTIMSLIGSFTANSIAREGKQFYITKIVPVSYRKQLLAKLFVNFVVSFIGLALCLIVIGCTCISSDPTKSFLTPTAFVMLIFISIFFLAGISFNGVNINLVRPKVEVHNSQTNESNIVIQLIIGIAITAIISVVSIVLNGVFDQYGLWIQLTILGLMIIYWLINFLIFWFTVDKKYSKLEVK